MTVHHRRYGESDGIVDYAAMRRNPKMSPFQRIGEIEDQMRRFRHKVYLLITAGFVLIFLGLTITFWAYFSGQSDVRHSTCQNSQTLVTQYEWFKHLSIQNATHLSPAEVKQRVEFYDKSERLVPTDACSMSLSQLQRVAATRIRQIEAQ